MSTFPLAYNLCLLLLNYYSEDYYTEDAFVVVVVNIYLFGCMQS